MNSGRIVSTKDSADYFIAISPPDIDVDKSLFIVKGYYPNGKIKFIGGSKINTLRSVYVGFWGFYKPILQGPYISFFPNTRKKSICNYKNGNQVGDETLYYPNGKLYVIKTHTKEEKLLNIECRDSTGKILATDGNGKWINFVGDGFKNYEEGTMLAGKKAYGTGSKMIR